MASAAPAATAAFTASAATAVFTASAATAASVATIAPAAPAAFADFAVFSDFAVFAARPLATSSPPPMANAVLAMANAILNLDFAQNPWAAADQHKTNCT
jgi:hypothetical protein